jgi:DNA-directed RNA polymerase I subunit RPA2
VKRTAFAKRGPTYTNFGCTMRCGRPDGSSQTVYLHYTTDGCCHLRVAIRKAEYFIPVVVLLKAFVDATDRAIYDRMVATPSAESANGEGGVDTPDTFVADRVEIMLRMTRKDLGLQHHEQCLAYLGNAFRVVLGVPDKLSDEDAGRRLLDEFIFVHLTRHGATSGQAKFDLLIYMVQKLYALVAGRIIEDNPDSPMNQEILLPGHLMLSILKEKLVDYLGGVRALIYRDLRRSPQNVNFEDSGEYLMGCLKRNPVDVTKKMEYFLSTGNLQSETGLDLMQISGYVMVAERLNYMRFLCHFRSIHRGSFFAEMKTTTVRKLLPEAWGFLCPVHTPDGSPCGLLNHLALNCKAVLQPVDTTDVSCVLVSLGMLENTMVPPRGTVPVVLDGQIIGSIWQCSAREFCDDIRRLKLSDAHPSINRTMEVVCLLPLREGTGKSIYPAVLLFAAFARMVRPVRNNGAGATEWVGSFEQVFLEIACQDADVRPDTTHQELAPTQMLSLAASLTPFSEFNQSPRNMYQCQMMKQTMGTPLHSFVYRTDTKLYRIQSPQAPLCRNAEYLRHAIDDYAMGTNAVVAVISYTGYDMEDAMIINKSSFERGFGHGSVYTAESIDLDELGSEGEGWYFGNPEGRNGSRECEMLDPLGLPRIGQRISTGEPLWCCVSDTTGRVDVHRHKKSEVAIVDEVRLLGMPPGHRGTSSSSSQLRRVCLKLRYNRNPVIGDKFSSRHGQKGTMAQLWPQINMPFTENGITPDVIINPHAFPSRMTIGMLIESMAGKAGAMHGTFQESTPFIFDEQNRAVDYFGEQLQKTGYAYYGNETMYSGDTGEEMQASIFIGLVYYQRLRHMVSDKEQVRATGPVNALTHQPIKGRKVGGGIRFGEMERDALLAHGCAFLLHDRLMRCSDYDLSYVCSHCGDLLAPIMSTTTVTAVEEVVGTSTEAGQTPKKRLRRRTDVCCRNKACIAANGGRVEQVALPFVFKYLVNELAAMNIRVTFEMKEH